MKQIIKNSFLSILFAYKNIFHWVISKMFISFSSYIIGIILAIPFLLIALIIIYFSPLELSNFFLGGEYLLQDAMLNKFWFILVLIFFVFSIIVLLIGISYKKILLAKLNLKYIEKEKLKITKNYYFNLKVIIKFFKISFIILGIILGITLIFSGLFIILVSIFGGPVEISKLLQNINNIFDNLSTAIFSISSLILFITYIVFLFYVLYRTYFSFFILTEDKKLTVKECLKKSIKKTKKFKKLIKFIISIAIFGILIFPITYLGQYIDFNSKNLSKYISYKQKINSDNTKNKLKQEEFYEYSALKVEYGKYSNKELLEKYHKNYIISIIFFIFHFCLIFGIVDLVVANFYKKEIK